MREDEAAVLEARIWADRGEGMVLVGERHTTGCGELAVTWIVAPEEIRGVFWIEKLEGEGTDPSAA